MEQSEVIAGNKLIAEFMGWTYYGHNDPRLIREDGRVSDAGWKKKPHCMWHIKMSSSPFTCYLCRRHTDLTYYRDWNTLMGVCKKIIDMYKDMRHDIFRGLTECNREDTWKAVVEFIKFWNDPSQPKYVWPNVTFPYSPMPAGEIITF